jgi:2-oxoglutarate dehydrogenase E2 component (dihydrolipoamide succinyltransferase)
MDPARTESQPTAIRQLVVPDLGIVGLPLTISLWLVPAGSSVQEGDRVVELSVGGATCDLESPVSGRLLRQLVDEDDVVAPGTVIAEFETTEVA